MNDDLDDSFKAARQAMPTPSAEFLARVVSDAEDVLAARSQGAAPEKGGFLKSLWDVLGGWPAASGMVTAGFLGLMIGISPPASVADWASGYVYGATDAYLVDPYDGFGFSALEG